MFAEVCWRAGIGMANGGGGARLPAEMPFELWYLITYCTSDYYFPRRWCLRRLERHMSSSSVHFNLPLPAVDLGLLNIYLCPLEVLLNLSCLICPCKAILKRFLKHPQSRLQTMDKSPTRNIKFHQLTSTLNLLIYSPWHHELQNIHHEDDSQLFPRTNWQWGPTSPTTII